MFIYKMDRTQMITIMTGLLQSGRKRVRGNVTELFTAIVFKNSKSQGN